MSSAKYKIVGRTTGSPGSVIVAYCDGSIICGNPGGHGFAGWVVRSGDLRECKSRPATAPVIHEGAAYLGRRPTMTSNVAEYAGVRHAMAWVRDHVEPNTRVIVRTDSLLVACQLRGEWNARKAHLAVLRDEILAISSGHACTFHWVPRGENTDADAMSRELHHLVRPKQKRSVKLPRR